jgi:peptide/nickel transport system ATP-binding protein
MTAPLLVAAGISKTYAAGGRRVDALKDASISLAPGETLGLAGPSGSGKSTLARVVLRLVQPDAGSVTFRETDLLSLTGKKLRVMRRRIQMVFQDPLGAFNPRTSVAGALADPLRIHGIAGRRQRPAAIARLLETVGLESRLAGRAIHDISGGQRQRVAIARALATEPDLIVLDEAVSALDVSVRGKILELLVDLQRSRGIAYLFVSHDLAVIRTIAHRIAIMDSGRIVESGPSGRVVADPQSATGRALVAAVPRLGVRGGGSMR